MGADLVLARGEPLPAFDVHAPLFSLPSLLGTTSPERIPADVPYLRCDPVLVKQWRTRLEEIHLPVSPSSKRVGIAWQGNPENKSDRQRSVPLERFVALSRIAGVKLISLQKGRAREKLISHREIIDLGRDLADFADTAAVLQSLDLVITVDTALAHLAGAMGVPVWVALALVPDWRWLLEREDSPWYPSMRLFRQKQRGEWGDVFERIVAAPGS